MLHVWERMGEWLEGGRRTTGLEWRVWVKEADGTEHLSILLSYPCRSPGQRRPTTGSITAFGWCIITVSKAWAPRHPETHCTDLGAWEGMGIAIGGIFSLP